MTYSVKRPFSPPIYISSLTDEFVTLLQTVARQSKQSGDNIGNRSLGNLDSQHEAVFIDNQVELFLNNITPHIRNCVDEFDVKRNIVFNNSSKDGNITYHLAGGPWINFQGPAEFNPLHAHPGMLAAVLYIDIPECIEAENKGVANSIRPSAGMIEFISGSDGLWWESVYSHRPKTGDLIIFPASLKHVVYPFKSDAERVSMSFNVYDINVS